MRPILYSFRRCPFAMRARLALCVAGIEVELREVLLRDKAPEFLATSPKGTVPVLALGDLVLEESLDIMLWALDRNDPEGWLAHREDALDLIAVMDGPFKTALDRYKYAARYDDADPMAERATAATYLAPLEALAAAGKPFVGHSRGLADIATLPFIRQFARTDLDWFLSAFPALGKRLAAFEATPEFQRVMRKYPRWTAGDPVTVFPEAA